MSISSNPRRTAKLNKLCDFYASHTDPITCVSLGQRSDRILATGSIDHTINCFRIGKTKPLMMFADNTASITCLQYNITDTNLCSGNQSGTVKIYDCSVMKSQYSYVGHRSSITCVDWYPHLSPLVGTGSNDSTVRLWDLRKNGCAQLMCDKLDSSQITAVKYCPDGKWVIVGNNIGIIRIWDNSTAKCIHTLQPSSTSIISIQLHPVEVIMACCTSTQCYIYDMDTFELIGCTPIDRNIRQIIFSEFSCDTVVVLCDSHIKIWNYSDNTCQLIDYIDTQLTNKSIVCDVKINELNIGELYEMTCVTRTDTSIGVYTVDMCCTELYNSIIPRTDIIDNNDNENFKPKHLPDSIRKATSKPSSPAKQPSKRAIDHPNTAFFNQNNLNMAKNDSIGSVVLSPAQPPVPSRPQSSISNNNISTPFNPIQVLKHSPNSNHDNSLRKSKTHWSAATPQNIDTNNNNHMIDSDMSTEHMSESGNHISIGVGQTLPPTQNSTNTMQINNSISVTPGLPPSRYPAPNSLSTPPATAPPVPAKPVITPPPPQSNHQAAPSQLTASDICQSLLQAHTVVTHNLQPRLLTVRSIRKSWCINDIDTVISELIQCTDFILIHNILTASESTLRDKLLTLDYCTQLTILLCKMLSSSTAQPISTALRYMQWICIQFNELIKNSLSTTNLTTVDIANDERIAKSLDCYKRMKHIYPRLAALSQREQPIGLLAKDFRSRLDIFISIEKKSQLHK